MKVYYLTALLLFVFSCGKESCPDDGILLLEKSLRTVIVDYESPVGTIAPYDVGKSYRVLTSVTGVPSRMDGNPWGLNYVSNDLYRSDVIAWREWIEKNKGITSEEEIHMKLLEAFNLNKVSCWDEFLSITSEESSLYR